MPPDEIATRHHCGSTALVRLLARVVGRHFIHGGSFCEEVLVSGETKKRTSTRPPVEPRGLTKKEAAKYLGLSESSLEKIVSKGRLRPIKYPGIQRYFFDRMALDLLIDQSGIAVMPATMPAKVSKYGFLDVARGGKSGVNR